MGTHPIFESDFDCLTEMVKFERLKNEPDDIEADCNSPNTSALTSNDPSFVESIKERATKQTLLTLGLKWLVFIICVVVSLAVT